MKLTTKKALVLENSKDEFSITGSFDVQKGIECADLNFMFEAVVRWKDVLPRIGKGDIDVFVADYRMIEGDREAALAAMSRDVPGVGVIVVLGESDETIFASLYRSGVADCLLRRNLDLAVLVRSMVRVCHHEWHKHIGHDQARQRTAPETIWAADIQVEEQQRSQLYLDLVEVIVVCLDADQRVTLINQKGCSLLGFKREELIGNNWFDLCIPEMEREKVRSMFQQVVAGKGHMPEFYQNMVQTWNGELRTISWHNVVIHDQEGTFISAVSSGQDVTDLQQAEEQARRTGSRMRRIADGLPVLIAYVDGELRYQFVNEEFTRWFGLTYDRIVGRHVREILGADFYASIRHHIDEVLNGKQVHYENVITTADGQTRMYEARYLPDLDARGQVIGYYLLTQDVTDRKHKEDMLLKMSYDLNERIKELRCLYKISALAEDPDITLDKLFQQTVNVIPEGWQYPESTRARITLGDKEYLSSQFKESPHKMSSQIVSKGIIIGQIEAFLLDEKSACDNNCFLPEEYELMTAISHRLGKIAERFNALAALQISEDSLNSLLELYQCSVDMDEDALVRLAIEEAVKLTRSATGYLHFINPDQMTIQLTAWSQATLQTCQSTFDEHYPLDRAGIWADSIRSAAPVIHNNYQDLPDRKGYPEGHSHVIRHLSVPVIEYGNVFLVLGVGNKETDYNQSDVRQLQLLGSDLWGIIKRKRAENKLRTSSQEIELRNKELDAYAHMVAHDLKTPLTTISGYASFLLNQIPALTPDEIKKYLSHIMSSIKRTDNIINELLLLGSLRNGSVLFDTLDMDRIVNEALDSLAYFIAQYDAFIERSGELHSAVGYAPWIIQIWINYISNAIKYGKKNSPIRIASAVIAEGLVRFSVTNDSEGNPPENGAKLFLPYSQVKNIRSTGHGLGLSIVRTILERVKGNYGYEQNGNSVTFYFDLLREMP